MTEKETKHGIVIKESELEDYDLSEFITDKVMPEVARAACRIIAEKSCKRCRDYKGNKCLGSAECLEAKRDWKP